jgi:hypothetical protein
MQRFWNVGAWGSLAAVWLVLILAPVGVQAQGPKASAGIYIKLTEDFYRALKDQGDSSTRTYSNHMSDEYLRRIAIASRYAVETNLQVLRQQERIIELLETIRGRSDAKP